MRNRWMLAGTLVVGAWLAAGPAYAQRSDADWLTQCKEQGGQRARHCEVRPVSLAWSGAVRVDASPNGGVQLTGADVANITGSARIQANAETEAEARAIAGQIVIDASTGMLRASGPKTSDNESWSVSFVLSVPRRTDVEVKGVNGPVAIAAISGTINAATTNGPMSVRELGGEVRVRTTNGPLDIVLGGTSWEGSGLDAETTNGPLRLVVPDGYSAQLESRTTNGPFHIGIPIPAQSEDERGRIKSVNAPIGGGGALIRAVTSNGPVTISKR